MGANIAFVEDDEVIRENYSDMLREEGYEVSTASNRLAADEMFDAGTYDLAILDVSLGAEFDAGYQLCSKLRQRDKDLPIIFLTSHDSEIDHISGLRVGADDYLSKDSSFSFLLVRIQTLLRRVADISESKTTDKRSQSLELDPDSCSVYWRGERVDLTLTQFWMLREIFESKSVSSIDQLMKAANITVEPNTVIQHIKSIRRKFSEIDSSFSSIKTERGRGYRWLD